MSHDALALPPGTLVDSLRIDRVVGQGAFGTTYLVTDTALDASFALKEYLPRHLVARAAYGRLDVSRAGDYEAFRMGLARFLEEGRTVAGLNHPNVVRVLRCIEANDTAYLLMPWYRGEALHTLLKRSGTLGRDEAVALGKPLLDALDGFETEARQLNARHHRSEAWRDHLLERGDPAVGQLMELRRDADAQAIRQLLRNAGREAARGKPPSAARALFRLLRELDETDPLPPL